MCIITQLSTPFRLGQLSTVPSFSYAWVKRLSHECLSRRAGAARRARLALPPTSLTCIAGSPRPLGEWHLLHPSHQKAKGPPAGAGCVCTLLRICGIAQHFSQFFSPQQMDLLPRTFRPDDWPMTVNTPHSTQQSSTRLLLDVVQADRLFALLVPLQPCCLRSPAKISPPLPPHPHPLPALQHANHRRRLRTTDDLLQPALLRSGYNQLARRYLTRANAPGIPQHIALPPEWQDGNIVPTFSAPR